MKSLKCFVLWAASLGAAAYLVAQTRFDHTVRNDFFAGMLGNAEALERGMKACEKVLAENPNHAEALVWHGAGLFFQSGRLFQSGDREKGMQVYQKAIAEMDRAVELEPANIGVRIPRGAALATAARRMNQQNPVRGELFQRALSDHQKAWELQKNDLDSLGEHPKGELLLALADLNSRLGKDTEARLFFDMILAKLPGTPYAQRATTWKETGKPLEAAQAGCIGCHTR